MEQQTLYHHHLVWTIVSVITIDHFNGYALKYRRRVHATQPRCDSTVCSTLFIKASNHSCSR